jgi:hypothetical protein
MAEAGRAPILPVNEEHIAPAAEALARAYLKAADGNRSHALRLSAVDRVSDLQRLQARVSKLQALVSRGFARWGSRIAERHRAREAR